MLQSDPQPHDQIGSVVAAFWHDLHAATLLSQCHKSLLLLLESLLHQPQVLDQQWFLNVNLLDRRVMLLALLLITLAPVDLIREGAEGVEGAEEAKRENNLPCLPCLPCPFSAFRL